MRFKSVPHHWLPSLKVPRITFLSVFLPPQNYHVIAASDELVYVWQFRTSFSKVATSFLNRVLPQLKA